MSLHLPDPLPPWLPSVFRTPGRPLLSCAQDSHLCAPGGNRIHASGLGICGLTQMQADSHQRLRRLTCDYSYTILCHWMSPTATRCHLSGYRLGTGRSETWPIVEFVLRKPMPCIGQLGDDRGWRLLGSVVVTVSESLQRHRRMGIGTAGAHLAATQIASIISSSVAPFRRASREWPAMQ